MKFRLKGASGPLTGQTFEVGEGLAIGSAPDADIRHDALRPSHARIRVDGGGLVLVAEGPVEVNGESVRERALESGDELRFVLQAPGLKPARILEPTAPVPQGNRWVWWLAGLSAAAGGTAAWWFLAGPGSGVAG